MTLSKCMAPLRHHLTHYITYVIARNVNVFYSEKTIYPRDISVFLETYSFQPLFFFLPCFWQLTKELEDYRGRQWKIRPVTYTYCIKCSLFWRSRCVNERRFHEFFLKHGHLSSLLSHAKVLDVRELPTSALFSVCSRKDCRALRNLLSWTSFL